MKSLQNVSIILTFVQLFFGIIIGLYFWSLLKAQRTTKQAGTRENRREIENLRRMRNIKLTEPLAEKTRPKVLQDIIGQDEGICMLKAALCGSNPQHVLIYGPPGVGKTAAARLLLEEAKQNPRSPFSSDAKFVEIDGATARFDERGIADPLIGSVHDPIYQGAGPLGSQGIPQPKPGAVTKAHGGMLFIDEVGELHNIQINKLLKVLEDRKVLLESAYYNPDEINTPSHIHDIFQNGLPADFRLVGATTRLPSEIPAAIRSRCVEVFFRGLLPEEIGKVARNASAKLFIAIEPSAVEEIMGHATNAREAVNIVQIAGAMAINANKKVISLGDVQWVLTAGQHTPRPDKKIPFKPEVGVVNGLAVTGPNAGMLLEIEVAAMPVTEGKGNVTLTGVVDEEELGGGNGKTLRRKSMAKASVENVITVLNNLYGLQVKNFDIHINFPGGIPVDGPSAGAALAVGVYSALKNIPVAHDVAITGEISLTGKIKEVGGVASKVKAASLAGAKLVMIPRGNWQNVFATYTECTVLPVDDLNDVFQYSFIKNEQRELEVIKNTVVEPFMQDMPLGAQGVNLPH